LIAIEAKARNVRDVQFNLDSTTGKNKYSKTEYNAPYVMNGNDYTHFLPWPYTLGAHTLKVTGRGGIGRAHTFVISFTVVDGGASSSSGSRRKRRRARQQPSSVDEEEEVMEIKTDVDAFRKLFADEMQSADQGGESIYWMFGYVLGYRMALKEGKEAGYALGKELGKKSIMTDYDLGYMYGHAADPVERRKLVEEAMQRHLDGNSGNDNANGNGNSGNGNGNGNAPNIMQCPLPFLTPEYPECAVIVEPSNGGERLRNLAQVANWRHLASSNKVFKSPQNNATNSTGGGGLAEVITPEGVDNGMDFKNLVKDVVQEACNIKMVHFQVWQSCIDVTSEVAA
jgi:hypothetical protein